MYYVVKQIEKKKEMRDNRRDMKSHYGPFSSVTPTFSKSSRCSVRTLMKYVVEMR